MSPAAASSVLITGASKGIGHATALLLDQKGFRVFAGVRQLSDAEDLRTQASDRLVPVMLDVTDPESITGAAEVVQGSSLDGLYGLVNNAGIVVAGPLEVLPLDQLRQQLEVNVLGVVAVTQAFLPLIRAGRGRIINVSSINGRLASPFAGAYCASKFALEALSDALRFELQRWSIQVTVIEPGAVATPIWQTSVERAKKSVERLSDEHRELYGRLLTKLLERSGKAPDHAVAPQRVAQKIHHALTARRPKTRYLVGRDARLGAVLALLPDRLRDRIFRR